MALAAGTRLGAYEVTAQLGAGGMGEVYRARDTRLKRDVALKVLPDALAADPERRARFQREAEILASLTHPNIAALYGLEDDGNIRALVMELVEGGTLAARIGARPMPVDDAVPLARQIVDALDYAHEQGVLHRDLKPANIKVTAEGQVKVLDFGLAKALDDNVPSATADDSPTITSPALTRAGIILGTAAYMAPEQVCGRVVDKRADIWSFGCVLYEMLTGTHAFHGETVSDTLAAVLKSETDWTRLPTAVPGPLRQLLEHCLKRDPKARLRDIADARLLLQASPQPTAVATREGAWRRYAMAAALAAALFAAGRYSSSPGSSSSAEPVRRLTVQLRTPLPVSTSGGGPALTTAPDGSAIAFIGRNGEQNQLFVHRFADGSTTALRGTGGPFTPVISPDGKWVAFAGQGSIRRVAVDGGDVEALCLSPRAQTRGGAWSAEGRLVFGSTVGLIEVTEQSAECRVTLALDHPREARMLWPQFLPRGRGLLLTISGVSDDADSASIVAVPAGTTERRVIVRGGRAGRVTPSGHLIFARGRRLFAAPFDLDRLAITADPVAVVEDVASGQFSGPLFGVSDRGDLVYASGDTETNHLAWVTRRGELSDTGAPPRSYQLDPRLSPDGRRVAVSIGTGDHFAWLYALDTGTLTPLVADVDAHGLVWSPDGRKVAFSAAGLSVSVKDLDAAGEPEVIREGNNSPWAWSPDGSALLVSRRNAGGGFDLVALSLPDKKDHKLVSSGQTGFGAQFSPDGRWVAYASDESGRLDVYVTDFPAARVKRPVSIDGGFSPVWSRDGRELFYVSGNWMMAAAVRMGDSIGFERPVRLFSGIEPTGTTAYSVAPDGRFLLVRSGAAAPEVGRSLTFVLNWFEELQRLVPARPIARWR